MKTLLTIFIIINIIFAIRVFQLLNKEGKASSPIPCDNCVHLKERRAPHSGYYRYVCSKRGKFDVPPEYCAKREIIPNKKTLSTNEANWEYFGNKIWDEENEEWFCAQCKNLLVDGYRCTQCMGEE